MFTTCTCLPPQTCALKLVTRAFCKRPSFLPASLSDAGTKPSPTLRRISRSHRSTSRITQKTVEVIQFVPQERIQERIPRSSADHGGNRRGDSARVPGGTDCGLPCATVHGGNCGTRADHTTRARAESHGQILDVPTPQIQEEIAAVIQLIPQERVSERIIEQTRCSSPSDSRPKCRNLEDHPTGPGSAAHGGADC